MRRNPVAALVIIILLAIFAGFFAYPKTGEKFRPWKLGLDLAGGSHLVYQVDLSKISSSDRESVLNGVRDVIERRVNLFGVGEPQVFVAKAGTENPELVVELAGVKDIGQAIQLIGLTPFLDFREAEQVGTSTSYNQTNLTGRFITGAQVILDNTTQQPQVSLSFNDTGAQMFEQMTERNVGKPIGIFLDNVLISAPVVQQKIIGGRAVITGKFTFDEAKILADRFNAGALPAPVTLINQQTLSASLGAGSLRKVLWAGVVGTLLVAIFMIIYYRKFGFFAALALIIYIFITLSIFKLIPITMTLAGIAGFVLTIGMAVDANILTFERIKEEVKRGLPWASAVEEGFRRAWPSIRDSNTSTMISAAILYYLTSSFVQGFAVSLFLGTLISMFSAITTTRLFIRIFMKKHVKSTDKKNA